MHIFPHCAADTDHGHEEVNSGQAIAHLHLDYSTCFHGLKILNDSKNWKIFPPHTHVYTPPPKIPKSLTGSDALAGQQHDASKADTEDDTLAKVQQGKRGCGF